MNFRKCVNRKYFKLLLLSILGSILAVWTFVNFDLKTAAQTNSIFWYDISLGAPLVDWYNQVARPEDFARVENMNQVSLLDRVTVGRRLMVFKSATVAEESMPDLIGRVDVLGYNLEHGPLNPEEEQQNPLEAILRMRALADQHGLQLALGPDRRFAESHGPLLAPYVDIFVLQVQRAQTDPETVYNFVVPLVGRLRRANPDLNISVQIRTEGEVTELADLVEAMRPFLDGVSILTSPDTTEVAVALVAELNRRNFDGEFIGPVPQLPEVEDNLQPEIDFDDEEPTNPSHPTKTEAKQVPTGVIVILKDVASAVAGALGGNLLPADPIIK